MELTARQRVERALSRAGEPLSFRTLRESCRIRTATLCEELNQMADQGQLRKTTQGYLLTDDAGGIGDG